MKKYQHVSVIVVFHNGKEQTLRCLKSVSSLNYPNFDVTVVDDGSTDGSSIAIKKEFPSVRIINGDGSLWCNGSFNLAIEEGLGEGKNLFLLLNNDNVISPDALPYLIDTYESKNVSIVGSLVCYYHQPDTVSYAGKLINWEKGRNLLIHNGKKLKSLPSEIISVDFLGFQGVLINRKVFDCIGLIDAKTFIHYAGDTDFYLRAKGAGFSVLVDTRSVVWDDISTKGDIGVKPSLWEFIRDFKNVKSLSHLQTRYRFYKRHSPSFWFKPFCNYYLRLIISQIINMIRQRMVYLKRTKI